MKIQTRMQDERDLMALHMVGNEKLSCAQAGKELGLSKNAVIGVRWRVNVSDKSDVCLKPENKDGGMPELWWQA